MKTQFTDELRRLCTEAGMEIDTDQVERMYAYFELIRKENTKYNLTAVDSPEAAARLHFFDSIAPCALLPHASTLLDVGSGAGFPAIPIKIMRPDVAVTALDSTEKKCHFIEMACQNIGIEMNVLCGRAEEVAQTEYRESFDTVCARAVAALPILLELTAPFAHTNGLLLCYKADYADELAAADTAVGLLKLSFVKAVRLPDDTLKHFVLVFRKEGPTDRKYPRRYAQIKKRPL